MSTLVNIQPLSQSRYEAMACPAGYVYQHVYGVAAPDNPYSVLGTEVHSTLQDWFIYLSTHSGIKQDEFLESRLKTNTQEAADMIRHFLDNFSLPDRSVLATELYLTGGDELEGTLDLLASEGAGNYRIYDWKTYHRIIDADTFQSKLYPLLVFLNYPDADRVSFTLAFVRYGCTRSVDFVRSDVPRLLEMVERERTRQVALHAYPQQYETEAIPGTHCIYCPLLRTRECPIEGRNPHEMKPKERGIWQVYLKQAVKANDEILKGYTLDRDIEIEDGNGNKSKMGHILKETGQFPMAETLVILMEWKEATKDEQNPEGDDLISTMYISRSALMSKLKAKKRAILHQRLKDICQIEQHTEFKIVAADVKKEEV